MYRLKVKCGKKWRIGRNSYTMEQAEARILELNKVGIKGKIFTEYELFK